MRTVSKASAVWLVVVAVCASGASAAVLTVGPGQTYSTVQAAVNAASSGDTIEIYSDTYTGTQGNALIDTNNLTLRGVGATRPILDAGGTSIQSKAIWVINGSNTTIDFVEFRNCTVPDQNGAGIRQQARDLTVRNCYFHDNENGILGGADTGSTILIEYSEFYNNGYGDGQSHNMYLGNAGTLILRHCWSHHAVVGHEVKTRANVNYIEYNRITNETGSASYEINIPNGGTSYIIGNMIEQGTGSGNSGIISYAEEGASNPDQHLYVINNTIVNNRGSGTFVRNASTTDCLLQNNIFQGAGTILNGPGMQVTNWVTSNAYLFNPANYDYHLTASSTGAIDTGSDPGFGLGYSLTPVYEYLHPTDYQSRPSDATLDIGAYEYPADPTAPVIDEVTPDPDAAMIDAEYTRQMTLSAGTFPITWTLPQGPAGADVTSGGYVYGWTPEAGDAGVPVTFEVQASNDAGSDTETWQVIPALPEAPVIDEVSPDPDNGVVGAEYTRQLVLSAGGGTSVLWTLPQGPAGAWVDQDGLVQGWIPSGAQLGQSILFEVNATNAGGQDSESWHVQVEAHPPAFIESGGMVCIEAEHYDVMYAGTTDDNWVLSAGTGAFGSDTLAALPDNGDHIDPPGVETAAPGMSYNVMFVTTGTYYLWVRGQGPNTSGDSVHYGLDGVCISTGWEDSSMLPIGGLAWTGQGNSIRTTIEVDTPGFYSLEIWMREDASEVDRYVLTTDQDYTPSGDGPAESPKGTGLPGDMDGDGDVELDDFAALVDAMNGPGVAPGDPAADLDEDGDCDMADVSIFAIVFAG